jgi:hypothetical protein
MINLSKEAFLAAGVLCVGLLGGLARGEELHPCLMAKRCVTRLMQAAYIRPQPVDRLMASMVLEDQLSVKFRGHGHDNTQSLMLVRIHMLLTSTAYVMVLVTI